jgi:signal transduction histidine kinase
VIDYQDLTRVDHLVREVLRAEVDLAGARAELRTITSTGHDRPLWAVTIGWGVMCAGVGVQLGGDWLVVVRAAFAAMGIDRLQMMIARRRIPGFYQQVAGGGLATLIAVGAAAIAASTAEEETRRNAEQLRTLAKRALAEMRAALGLVDGHEPAAGPAEIAALVAGSRAAGVDVELWEHGDPVDVSPGVGRAVYRVVQESLTNAARHAPGATVRVDVRRRPTELRVSVINIAPGRAAARRPRFGRGGAGLTGLAERVSNLGGQLEAGPEPGGGFAVRATFPLTPAPVTDPTDAREHQPTHG